MPFITQFNGKAPGDSPSNGRVEKGALENARASLVSVLEERFGEIPPAALEMLNAIDNPHRLRTLMREAVSVPSLSEFLRRLQP